MAKHSEKWYTNHWLNPNTKIHVPTDILIVSIPGVKSTDFLPLISAQSSQSGNTVFSLRENAIHIRRPGQVLDKLANDEPPHWEWRRCRGVYIHTEIK